ncbi:MAG: DNA polymerase IV [Myxococcota bacterium]
MKIIHVDMDAFYASVEQRDRPDLRGRPVAVGGRPGGRGVVAAASYEARSFGVRSAMPCSRAARLCPDLVFVPPDFAKYAAISRIVRGVFDEVTDLVEPMSLDEAYLDVTRNRLGFSSAVRVARWVKATIRERTHLTASAGVGPNKLVAKLASGMDKPDGLVVVPPEDVDGFLVELPARKLWGVGPKTASRLEDLGVRSVADLRRLRTPVVDALGRQGAFLVELAFGRDERPVVPERPPKSRGAEATLANDVLDRETLEAHMRGQCGRIEASLEARRLRARTVTLKLRYSNFDTITRRKTVPSGVKSATEIHRVASQLLNGTEAGTRPVRLVGVTVSQFEADRSAQLEFFGGDETRMSEPEER